MSATIWITGLVFYVECTHCDKSLEVHHFRSFANNSWFNLCKQPNLNVPTRKVLFLSLVKAYACSSLFLLLEFLCCNISLGQALLSQAIATS